MLPSVGGKQQGVLIPFPELEAAWNPRQIPKLLQSLAFALDRRYRAVRPRSNLFSVRVCPCRLTKVCVGVDRCVDGQRVAGDPFPGIVQQQERGLSEVAPVL